MSSDTVIGIVVGIFITLIGGFFVSWTSVPLLQKIKKWRDDQAQKIAMKSVKNAKKRIDKLEQELTILSVFIQNPTKLNAASFGSIALILLNLVIALSMGFLYLVIFGGTPVKNEETILQLFFALEVMFLFASSAMLLRKLVTIFERASHFPEYETKTRKQIEELHAVIKKFEGKGLEI
jgi:uncharacterized membrane protein (DUF106 family)